MKIRYCQTCGIKLSTNCSGNYCNRHRDRTGANNPFFGKAHSQATIQKIKEKCKIASESLWKDDSYREKIKTSTNGLKRSSSFKSTQRKNALKQFKSNHQRQLRSNVMKNSWKTGKIKPNNNPINKSRGEIELYKILSGNLGKKRVKWHKTILTEDKNWFIPDITIDNKIIVEYNGDYWHANPLKYNGNDIIHHNISANEIWEKDLQRNKKLEEFGYNVIIVWLSDWKKNKFKVVDDILSYLKKF
jgi:G:T-mismatch repair DNA endonuclease (very short patch repair protein)